MTSDVEYNHYCEYYGYDGLLFAISSSEMILVYSSENCQGSRVFYNLKFCPQCLFIQHWLVKQDNVVVFY